MVEMVAGAPPGIQRRVSCRPRIDSRTGGAQSRDAAPGVAGVPPPLATAARGVRPAPREGLLHGGGRGDPGCEPRERQAPSLSRRAADAEGIARGAMNRCLSERAMVSVYFK